MREIERGGVTYTIDTLRALRSQLPGRPLVLVMGSDQFARLDVGATGSKSSKLAHIAVATRAGAAPAQA